MPAPRVFVSSTFYDLRYIRENLRFFIGSLGYDPILAEEGAVFYDPTKDVREATVSDVASCQILVLIIGGRRGAVMPQDDTSVTNAEYREAAEHGIPVFVLVERAVLEQYRVFVSNKQNTSIDVSHISYPAVDSTSVFDFIEEVQHQAVNNALFPFADFGEIQAYLKQQWASMAHRWLTTESESKRVDSLVSALKISTDKIEYFTRQIVGSVGDPMSKIKVEFYDLMLERDMIKDLLSWGLRPTPQSILIHGTLDLFTNNQLAPLDPSESAALYHGGPPYRASVDHIDRDRRDYTELRQTMIDRLATLGISEVDFLQGIPR